MGGALWLLLVLIATTLLLRPLSDLKEIGDVAGDRRRVQLHDQRHEGEVGRLHAIARTPVRGSEHVRGTARGDGGRASGSDLLGGKDTRAGAFSRLREESPRRPNATQTETGAVHSR